MSNLVNELKKDHESLLATLDEVTSLGISSEEGLKKLLAVKEGLLAHLSREDRDLYPPLKKAAESDAALQHTLDVFAKDMTGISQTALDFFGKYIDGGSSMEFARDFGRLVAALKNRIGREEDILYPQYEKRM